MDAQDAQVTEIHDEGCYVALTRACLSVQETMDRVRSPEAGAIVIFAGTTRDNFGGKPVKELQYSAYNQLALRTMLHIAKAVYHKHSLKAIAMIHRLGVVPIGEESILIAVSAPHREAAWRAGEESLEECKARVEIWKREEFEGQEGIWKANRDGIQGQKLTEASADDLQIQQAETGISPAGPVVRPQLPGEKGHGPVVNPKPSQASSNP